MNDEPTLTVHASGTKVWRLHGEVHRDDAPAVEWADGTKAWYLHGELHRVDGAAVERADGTKQWWLHGKLHRAHGPAIEWADGATAWYLHNVYYASAEDWAEASLQMQNKSCDAANVDAFLKQILKKQVQNAL